MYNERQHGSLNENGSLHRQRISSSLAAATGGIKPGAREMLSAFCEDFRHLKSVFELVCPHKEV